MPTSFWAVPEAKRQNAALVPRQTISWLGQRMASEPAAGLLGAFKAGLTGQGPQLRVLLRFQDLSGWASPAGSMVAAAALQSAEVLHLAVAQSAGTLQMQGVSTQAADWSIRCCVTC